MHQEHHMKNIVCVTTHKKNLLPPRMQSLSISICFLIGV